MEPDLLKQLATRDAEFNKIQTVKEVNSNYFISNRRTFMFNTIKHKGNRFTEQNRPTLSA